MPHSLRAKLKYMAICGHITKKDYEKVCKALDAEKSMNAAVEEIKALDKEYDFYTDRDRVNGLKRALQIIDKHMKGEKE